MVGFIKSEMDKMPEDEISVDYLNRISFKILSHKEHERENATYLLWWSEDEIPLVEYNYAQFEKKAKKLKLNIEESPSSPNKDINIDEFEKKINQNLKEMKKDIKDYKKNYQINVLKLLWKH